MHELQKLLEKREINDFSGETKRFIQQAKDYPYEWAEKYIYGIEKDYRLVKVGKVGCYLHGDGLAQVIHSDGLAKFGHSEYKERLSLRDTGFPKENKQFEVLVSNPPYSVSSFKNTSRDYYGKEDFELYESLTDNSSEIECLFIERTAQLLKDGGVAGIILPSSILNNEGIYTKAREIILKNFGIIGITELGSNTFMATGTNTVVLFLRRRSNYDQIHLQSDIEQFFKNWQDITLKGIEYPISKYVNYVWNSITFDDYVRMLKKEPNEVIKTHEIYKDYQKKINYKKEEDFWSQLIQLEKEKLLYFILAYGQKVVRVKTGEKTAEKQFLGYEFSNRRGNEGIHSIQRDKTISECTKLFDEDRFDNEEKASTYIYKAFSGDIEFPIQESLKDNISRIDLIDMLTFNRADFNKTISTDIKKKVKIESKWDIVKLGNVSQINYGTRIVRKSEEGTTYPVFGGGGETFKADSFNRKDSYIISRFGMSPSCVRFVSGDFFLNDSGMTLESSVDSVDQKYLDYYIFLNQEMVYSCGRGVAQKNIDITKFKSLPLPLPPKKIQEKIISEIEDLEKKEAKEREQIENLEDRIAIVLGELRYESIELGDVVSFKNGLNYRREDSGDIINIVGVNDFKNNMTPDLDSIQKIQIKGSLSEGYILQSGDLLVVRSNGSANLVGRFLLIEQILPNTSFSGFTIRLRPDLDKVNSKYLCYYLRTEKVREKLTRISSGSNIKNLNQTLLSNITISLPPLLEQERIVSKIEEIEEKIAEAQKIIKNSPILKTEILKKYL